MMCVNPAPANCAGPPEPGGIEVTPEMIAAAIEVLREHYLGEAVYDLTPPVLAELYRAMRRYERVSP